MLGLSKLSIKVTVSQYFMTVCLATHQYIHNIYTDMFLCRYVKTCHYNFFPKNIYNDRLKHTQIFYVGMLKPVFIIFSGLFTNK